VELSEKLGQQQEQVQAKINQLLAEGKAAEAQAIATFALYAAVNTILRYHIVNDWSGLPESFFQAFGM
jgi:hypothetical protein